jgi:hypothetical protein
VADGNGTPVTSDPTSSLEAVSASPGNLSLAGDNQDRDSALRLLQSVDSKLLAINLRKLRGSDREAYDRAVQLAKRARGCLDDHDYAAASSLAAKASSLANAI